MPPPCNKKEVQSFIGMINYLTKFSPHLTKLSEPVRELIKEKVPFNWGPEHQESFEALKKGLICAPVLAYYNPRKETVLQTKASTKGLGACLLQDDKPIYIASKALMETQQDMLPSKSNHLPLHGQQRNFTTSYMDAISY